MVDTPADPDAVAVQRGPGSPWFIYTDVPHSNFSFGPPTPPPLQEVLLVSQLVSVC